MLSEVRQRAFGFFEQTYPTTPQNALWRKFEQSENKAKVSEALFCSTFKYMRSFKNIILKFNKVFKIWGKEKVQPLKN
ncbi:MAG: hypothetical protein V1891_02815 [bacterium]